MWPSRPRLQPTEKLAGSSVGRRAGVERGEVHVGGRSTGDQLGHRFAGRGCIEDAPDAVPGGDVGARDVGDGPDQRRAICGDRPEAGAARDDRARGQDGRQTRAHRLQPRECAPASGPTVAGSTGSAVWLEMAQT